MTVEEYVKKHEWHTIDIYDKETGALNCHFDRKTMITAINRERTQLKYAHTKNIKLRGFYSDRLHLWFDYKTIDALREKHKVGNGSCWPNLDFETLTNFLSELFGETMKVVGTVEYRNYANGYPYWYIIYEE